ncbi:hypothetical protein Y032_0278g1173 [Ancylostoma ceylanicum]|uniref:MULE transposase domain-containing protein n=1 Tax=Ancylostoma ceylanicum TaxID=53326 RepID=A0A016S755_9BILA|nr:hypothetical protein Y032_0278g1173 [Ancylostoma ceylanicum]
MEELLKRDDIAGYKYVKTSHPTGDGFVLAVVTKNGQKYLDRYGYRGLVFDDTFNVTRYSFRLATLLVTDDAGNGFPCGFLLSFRMTSEEIAVLFEVVRDLIPHFDTHYVMTDDCGSFYNGFRKVFPASRAQKILCKFHLGQSVGRKLKEKLSKEDASDGKEMFREVLSEALPLEFERAYSAFMTWLATKDEELVSDRIFDLSHGTWGVLSKSKAEVLYTVTIGDPCDCDILVVAYAYEVMRSCMKKNLPEFINEETDNLENKTKEIAEKTGFNCEVARRPVVQSVGRTPKPKPIQAYKTRGQQKMEKRKRTKAEQFDYNEVQKKRIREALETRRTKLGSCFVCGKRDPPNCRSEDIMWFSCTNLPVCKAWAHESCSGGLGNICQLCKKCGTHPNQYCGLANPKFDGKPPLYFIKR